MAKSFSNLRLRMSPERVARNKAASNTMFEAIALQELRASMNLTQSQLADSLNMRQASFSKLENQSDMHVSTLQKVIDAMGGELTLVARFPDRQVAINLSTDRATISVPGAKRTVKRKNSGQGV